MVRAGAVGYVGKDQPGDEVLRAIHRSADGRSSIAVDRLGEVAERLAEHQASQVVQIAERARVSTERIEEAIHGDVLAMVFQPIVELRSGRVHGLEALARFMTRPRRSPETWFAEAASHGLLAQLELAAATRAFEHLDRIPEGVYLSVNFSPETICDPRIVPLLQTGAADRVVVELTERSPIAEHDEARACLDDIRALGVRLAIDDVGSGFSGLGQVVDLSPDLIKLDRSLVASLDSDDTKRALVARLTSFAVEVGMEVVAEGIETEAELDTLVARRRDRTGVPSRPARPDPRRGRRIVAVATRVLRPRRGHRAVVLRWRGASSREERSREGERTEHSEPVRRYHDLIAELHAV